MYWSEACTRRRQGFRSAPAHYIAEQHLFTYKFPEHPEKLGSSNGGYCTVSDGEIINTFHKIVKKNPKLCFRVL